jgi:hypothetical protein
MICIICGQPIGAAFPVPVAEIRFTPIVPHIDHIQEPDHGPVKLGLTVLQDRLCCQDCYKKIQANDFKAIEEAGQMPKGR